MIHNDPPIARITPLQNDHNKELPQTDSRIKKKTNQFWLKSSKKPVKDIQDVLDRQRKRVPKFKGYKEDILQMALTTHLDKLQQETKAFWWFHVPNGGKRTRGAGDKLRKQGLKSGVADICIILPQQKVIWIELKAIWGRLEPEQEDFCEAVCELDHKYYVVKGALPQDVIQQTSTILRDNGVLV